MFRELQRKKQALDASVCVELLKNETRGVLSVIGDEVDGDWEWLDRCSLKVRGIPENSRFAVRFRSEKPLVVTHKKHAASYHSTLNG